MNWAMFAFAVSGLLLAAWLWLAVKRRWSWAGLYASFGCLVAAAFNSAAPVRGLVDPAYVGYRFGLLEAERGVMVTLFAGAIFAGCAISALLAVSRTTGRALWIVAVTCAAMFVVNGVPTLQSALADPSANAIQFGEYLTIPGVVATLIDLVLLTLPFAVGAVWAPRAALRTD